MENHKAYVGCGILVLNPTRDKVLLSIRTKDPDRGGRQLPGGTVELGLGENPMQASIREVKEETGFDLKHIEFLCLAHSQYYGTDRSIHTGFVAQVDTDIIPPNPEPENALEWQWHSLNNLPSGSWFHMSKVFVDFYNKLQTNPTLSRFIIDERKN